MSSASTSVAVGALVLGRYLIRRLLGEGGMGAVFEAEDRSLRRMCALKVLLPKFHGDTAAYQRFAREAAFAASLDHENVVRVFDRGELADGSPFYTMELLRGRSLADEIELTERLLWPRARHIIIQLCRVLSLAHAQGIVHRDLKPENCFLVTIADDPDFLKLLDFGIARQDLDDPHLTKTGDVVGTPLYLSPQQVRQERADHRADVYAVGLILYQMLRGVHPFERANSFQVQMAILGDPVPSLTEFGCPPALSAVVARAMHRELAERYTSAEELRLALESLPDDATAPPDSRPEAAQVARVNSPTALARTQAGVPAPSLEPSSKTAVPALATIRQSPTVPVEGQGRAALQVRKLLSRRPLLGLGTTTLAIMAAVALFLQSGPEPSVAELDVMEAPPAPPMPTLLPPELLHAPETKKFITGSRPELEEGPVEKLKTAPKTKARKKLITQRSVTLWASNQELDPPAECEIFKKGYVMEFQLKLEVQGDKWSVQRVTGNTGKRCADKLMGLLKAWANHNYDPLKQPKTALFAKISYGLAPPRK